MFASRNKKGGGGGKSDKRILMQRPISVQLEYRESELQDSNVHAQVLRRY